MQNSGCHGNKTKNFKNLLFQNHLLDFIVIWHECSLGGLLLDSLKKFWLDKNMAAVGEANFHYMAYSET